MGRVASLGLVVVVLCFCTSLFGQYSSFIPTWKVGDSWTVETQPLAFGMPKRGGLEGGMVRKRVNKKEKVFFKVVRREKLEGVSCFVIKVTNTVMPELTHYLYIRERQFTLKRFVEVYGKGKNATKKVIDNPSKAFVLQDLGILCPFDFPKFPNIEKDHVSRTTLGKSGKKLVQTFSFNKDRSMLRIELRTKVNGKTLKSIQVWKKGQPWWSEAVRYWGGEKWEMGKLVGWKLVPRKVKIR